MVPVPALMCDAEAELLRTPDQPALHKKCKGLKGPHPSPKQSQRINPSRQFFPTFKGKLGWPVMARAVNASTKEIETGRLL